MNNIENPPAFPSQNDLYVDTPNHGRVLRSSVEDVQQGMSLRDWFAGQAINGMLTNDSFLHTNENETVGERLARSAYELADAMLLQRSKKDKG